MNPRTTTIGARNSAVAATRVDLAQKIAAHARIPGEQTIAIPGLTLYRLTTPTACYAAEYETGLAVIVQGRKRVTLGKTTYLCDESTFLLTSVDVPLISEIVVASEKMPLLALFLKLDLAIVRELLGREEFRPRNGQSSDRSMPLGKTTSDLLRPCIRLVDLLNTPREIPFFSNLIHREIVYRLLQYPQGDRLRSIAKLDDHAPAERQELSPGCGPTTRNRFVSTSSRRLRAWVSRRLVIPEPLAGPILNIEGFEVEVVEFGEGESKHIAAVHVPDLRALLSAVLVDNNAHLYLQERHLESWLARLDELAAYAKDKIAAIYPGHGSPAGLELIGQTRNYLRDFAEAVKCGDAKEAEQQMLAKYPQLHVKQFLSHSLGRLGG